MFDNSMRMLPIIIAILKLLFTEQNVQRYTFVHIKIIEAMGKKQSNIENLESVLLDSFSENFRTPHIKIK